MEPLINFPQRAFRIWLYTVGHQTLLLRSMKTERIPTRVDVLFKPVAWMNLPTGLNGLIVEAANAEQAGAIIEAARQAGSIIEAPDTPRDPAWRCFVVRGAHYEGYIVATGWDVDEGPYGYNEPDRWGVTSTWEDGKLYTIKQA